MRVRHKSTKSNKPVFEISGLGNEGKIESLDQEEILKLVDALFDKDDKFIEEVHTFYDPSVKVELEKNN